MKWKLAVRANWTRDRNSGSVASLPSRPWLRRAPDGPAARCPVHRGDRVSRHASCDAGDASRRVPGQRSPNVPTPVRRSLVVRRRWSRTGRQRMASATSAFFADLATRGHDPVLGHGRGTVRIDLAEGAAIDSWWVALDDGSIRVSRDEGPSDCIVRTTPEAFEELAAGRTGALAATLRGRLEIEGDPRLLVRFQRLFPPPTGMPKAAGARTAGKRRG